MEQVKFIMAAKKTGSFRSQLLGGFLIDKAKSAVAGRYEVVEEEDTEIKVLVISVETESLGVVLRHFAANDLAPCDFLHVETEDLSIESWLRSLGFSVNLPELPPCPSCPTELFREQLDYEKAVVPFQEAFSN